MGWIDSHCHLDFDHFDQALLLPQLIANECEAVLVPATQAKYFDRVTALNQTYPEFVKIALGLHPYFIKEHNESDLVLLEQAINQFKPDALGEFGLDFMLAEDTFNQQFYYFNQQLLLAKQHRLPLVIHCRKAHDKLASAIKKSGFHHGGFIHGFSGSLQQAKRYIDLGFVLGLGGALTYERAKAMHKMVAALPDDAYTLETDSPDMPPSFAQGQSNTPLNIPKIAECIAHLKGQHINQVIEDSTRNFYRVLAP
ncbi:MAG: TatD DNase family protein [Oceanicoccus sp.]|jgi:TatD DNase family protein